MINRIFFFIATVCFFFTGALAQIPAGYYNTASGKTGAELKTALYNIIKGHTIRSYPLWSWYDDTDLQPAPAINKIWDIYSDNCDFTFSSDQCGNYSNVCDCYNNEHSFPKSWFNDVSPMNSDIFHIYPTDGKVNGMRSNYPYGETNGTAWGNGKLGSCTYPGYTGTVFEPADEYKGDLARTYFYMATRYENVFASWQNYDVNGNAMMNGTSYPCYEPWALSLLLKWHNQDPVSQKEIDRNNKIHQVVQYNRNPYIDHPEYAQLVWNPDGTDVTVINSIAQISVYPNPASETINVTLSYSGISTYYVADISGRIVLNGVLNHENSTGAISLNGVSEGIYFLRIIGNNQSAVVRFVVAK